MDKRFILAIVLSLLILLSWTTLVSKVYHIDNKGVTQYNTSPPVATTPEQVSPSSLIEEPQTISLFNFPQENFEVIFNEPQAAIKEVQFKSHQSYKFLLKYGLLLGDKNLPFKRKDNLSDTVTFVYEDQTKKITKRFIFSKYNYDIWLDIQIQNLSTETIKLNLPLVLGVLDFSPKNIQARYQDVTVATKDRILHQNANVRKPLEFPDVKFISLRDRYFCAIIEPESGGQAGFIKKVNLQESEIGLHSQDIVVTPGRQIGQKFHIYLGPQDLRLINSIKPNWSAVIYYGVFDFISQVLLQILGFLYRIVHNWGWSIVIFSFIVYIILYPFTLKQMRSMKEMQALQPHVEELRKTYKDNPQRLNKEIMELYRQHKVNPLGGCLPLLLQMPIFIALYQALMRLAALKGANFLWIKDLSEPDRLFILPVSLPILGNEVNILPILMTIGMFIQQKVSMVNTGSASAEQQKLMMIIFPLMFGFIFYHMPSGLVLYWFLNSTLMLLYQFRISRKK